jgi:hypothetical protein
VPAIPPGATPREAAEALRNAPDQPAAMKVLATQRGPAFASDVALFLRPQSALPPTADNLRLYREGMPRLRSLAWERPPGADWGAATRWITEVTTTLETVAPIADGSMLVFESVLVEDHDPEYGAAGSDIRPLVMKTLEKVVPVVRATGTALRDGAVRGIDDSSVADADRQADPQLPALADVTAWRRQATALHAVANDVDRGGGAGLADAAAICEDAALAVLQARSVLSARATWRSGATEETPVAQVNANRPRTEVDDIFADSGFGARQSLRNPTELEDWCGMFVAAGMFRGAGLDKDMRMAFAHTDNVWDFFNYTAHINDERTPLSIWADGRWWGVSEYHEARGLKRRWAQDANVHGADIRPGDVALIRHTGNAPPAWMHALANHIVMVESYDPVSQRMVTIEGNVSEGVLADGDGGQRTADGGALADGRSAHDSSVVQVRDLSDPVTTTPGAAAAGTVYQERGARTVWGVGRPSLVDFEDHVYAKQEVPVRFRTMSPEQMRAAGAGALLQRPSVVESPADSPYHRRAG